jgi:transcription initiation factor TFIIA small subunit
MKILSNYDRVVTEVLADKVRARLTFKVHNNYSVFPPGPSV